MRDITALHPRLQSLASELKEKCAEQGIGIKFGECLRTAAEQDALYAQGRTTSGSIVTNAKGSSYSSQHQWGIAVDFYLDMDIDGDGSKSDDAFNDNTKMFEKVGAIAKSIGLGWGGDWTSIKDLPHLYLPDWGSTTSKLKSKYGTPAKFMKTWGTATASPSDGNLRKGDKGDDVAKMQEMLIAAGYQCGAVDGKFGSGTESALKAFQKDNGLTVDGVYGAKTKAALEQKSKGSASSSATSGSYSLQNFVRDVQAAIGVKVDGIAGSDTLEHTITVSEHLNNRHKVVAPIQMRLNSLGFDSGKVDGVAGKKFTSAVKRFQSANRCVSDGEITAKKATWRKLLGME